MNRIRSVFRKKTYSQATNGAASDDHQKFMDQAIREACANVQQYGGGPFGAVTTMNGKVVAVGSNKVTINNDPTAHAEVMCIRNACEKMAVYDLKGCELYSSCEPCPMCLSACYWANVDKIYYGANQKDAARHGFDDAFLYKEVAKSKKYRKIPIVEVQCANKHDPFQKWVEKTDKSTYGNSFSSKCDDVPMLSECD